MTNKRLVKASILEADYGIPRGSVYKLARNGLIPCYKVGPKLSGVRFVVEEVLEALRRPSGEGFSQKKEVRP